MSPPSADTTAGHAPDSTVRDDRTPHRMRAAVLVAHGGPDAIRMTEIPTPAPADDEVLLEVHTVGANQLDLNTMHGRGPGAATPLPLVLGADPAGVVVAHGSMASADLLGRRVVVKPNIPCGRCPQCRAGHEADCPAQTVVGVHRDGGAAPYVAVPARNVFEIGDLDAAAATAAVHSVPIALHALRAAGGTGPGQTVLVTGAGGAVGSAAVSLALDAGARVIAASTSRALVRDEVRAVRYDTAAQLDGLVRQISPDGVDLAVDGSGHGDVIGAAIGCLAWQGRMVVVGASLKSTIQLDGRDLYLRRKTVVGAASADYADVRDALAMVTSGAVPAPVGPTFPLDRIAEAYAAVGDRSRTGKVILRVR